MKQTRRTAQVGQTIRDALVEIFRRDLKDITLPMVSVNSVDVSPDLHFARVYITGFKEDEAIAAVEALQQRRGRIRGLLGQRIHLRYTPELDFKYDESAMRAMRVETLLRDVIPPNPENESLGSEPSDDDDADAE
jgi:ribosome-binding factor A